MVVSNRVIEGAQGLGIRTALLLLSISFFVLSAAADTEGEPVITLAAPPGLTASDVSTAIRSAATRLKWSVMEGDVDSVHIQLIHRGREANLHFTIAESGGSIEIQAISDSWTIRRNGQRKKRDEPEGWIANIRRRLIYNMDRVASSKPPPLPASDPKLPPPDLPAYEWVPVKIDADELRNLFVNESGLLDPFSVQFRKVHRRADDNATMCGQINAKNQLGAYAGWSRFYLNGTTIFTDSSEDDDVGVAAVEVLCRGLPD